MTAANMQIVQLYEQEGMSPEEISASDLGFDLLSVKAVLLQCSSLYRDFIKSAAGDNTLEDAFTKEDQLAARDVIARIALYGDENPDLQFRAAKYLRDDAKGRLDVAAGISSLNINVTLFQQQLDKVQRARALTLAKSCKSIDVKSITEKSTPPEGRALYKNASQQLDKTIDIAEYKETGGHAHEESRELVEA